MSNLFDGLLSGMVLLNSSGCSDNNWDWSSYLDIVGLVFNFLAAAVLIVALFPPFLDTRRSKMTYGLSDNFFLCYTGGGACMLANAFVNILVQAGSKNCVGPIQIRLIVLFCVFLVVNCVSVYINSYILMVKKSNMRAAAEKGMTEQAYWETYLNPARNQESTEVL